jgi:oxygen-independent coproporphyrinogen-3 oxidase
LRFEKSAVNLPIEMDALTSLGIYIHIPVCRSLCGYCDFYSIKDSEIDSNFWSNYYHKLVEEFQYKSRLIQNNYVLNSIYFGGGTPSLAPASFIEKLIDFLVCNVPKKSKNMEISIEANPETVTKRFVGDIHSAGINRISMGVQSTSDRLLKLLDRLGDKKTILRAMEILSKGPIANWSADIIYGIPGQKELDILESLQQIIDHGAKHISAYALTLENQVLPAPVGLPIGSQDDSFKSSKNKKISATRQHSHQKLIWEFLPANGFFQYEISNFARKGFSCLHNVAVWKYRPYLSLGASGHSFLNDSRYRTVANITKYLSEPVANSILIEKASTIPDLFITALRLKTRQGNALFRKHLDNPKYLLWLNQLNKFYNKGWIKPDKSGFTITEEGLNFSNTLLESVYEHL